MIGLPPCFGPPLLASPAEAGEEPRCAWEAGPRLSQLLQAAEIARQIVMATTSPSLPNPSLHPKKPNKGERGSGGLFGTLTRINGHAKIIESLPGEVFGVAFAARRDRDVFVAHDLFDRESAAHLCDDSA